MKGGNMVGFLHNMNLTEKNLDRAWRHFVEMGRLADAHFLDLVAALPPTGPHYTGITELEPEPQQDEGW